tara:strand:- start:16 stop:1257 length:1242 start_codon:yes stop_codon:yes gene_type:complete
MSLAKALSNLGPRIADTGKLIGGLMYTDELKTKDRLFAALTKREDRIYNEGRDNLKAAQGGYKEVWKKSHSSWKVLADQYYKYKDSTGVPGEEGAYMDSEMIKSMKAEMDQLWDIQESSKEQYLRSVGINYKRAEQPDVDVIGDDAKKIGTPAFDTMEQVLSAKFDGKDDVLASYEELIKDNKDLGIQGLIDEINLYRYSNYEATERAKGIENLDPEFIKEQSYMNAELEAQVRERLRVRLLELSEDARIRIDQGRFSEAANPQSLYQPQLTAMRDERAKVAEQNALLQQSGINADVRDMYVPDPYTQGYGDDEEYIRGAEARAQARTQNVTAQQPQGMISATEQGIATTQASQRGPEEAYSDAKEIISTLLQQFPAQLAQQHFIEMVGELELNQIEMQAFQQAFQEMFGMSL